MRIYVKITLISHWNQFNVILFKKCAFLEESCKNSNWKKKIEIQFYNAQTHWGALLLWKPNLYCLLPNPYLCTQPPSFFTNYAGIITRFWVSGNLRTMFPENFAIWREILDLQIKTYIRNWREILIVFPGNFFPAMIIIPPPTLKHGLVKAYNRKT